MVAAPVPPLVEFGTQTPVSDFRSPTRWSQRAVEVWSNPLAEKFTVPPPPVAWPWNDVNHTSVGMTAESFWNSPVQSTSFVSTERIWVWRVATSAASVVLPWSSCTWRWSRRTSLSASAALRRSVET